MMHTQRNESNSQIKERYPTVHYYDPDGILRIGFLQDVIKHGRLKGWYVVVTSAGMEVRVQTVRNIEVVP